MSHLHCGLKFPLFIYLLLSLLELTNHLHRGA